MTVNWSGQSLLGSSRFREFLLTPTGVKPQNSLLVAASSWQPGIIRAAMPVDVKPSRVRGIWTFEEGLLKPDLPLDSGDGLAPVAVDGAAG